ncbi:branched-chain-amino-acid transaminase [Egicoccus halophilus]|uniref:branched-chain-amino-acid transaminase n=1 Tax=Egicoccus halophilus TaxID=1670830 RepID=A0A8J3AB85_9ACTN|nr:branched-chain-amino-acid transaminase [Egicoccus halophilus]GGI09660.1 branched chain amino acid aminotransferase [Egicoccus halophilus]
MSVSTTPAPAFGTVMASRMALATTDDGVFGAVEVVPTGPVELHPAAHALHYGSACFEGLKAHPGVDGKVRLFRPQRHAERLGVSAELLSLPVPPVELVTGALRELVAANLDDVPPAPGALYLRPVLLGVDPNIGAAAAPSTEALLYVLASPVGDYFRGDGGLTLAIETELPRTTPQFGQVKCGANYAMALGVTRRARAEHGADQVLFAPGGDVQETGAANFLLLDDRRVVTKALDPSFLHGVTRDSILTLARDLGYEVEERDLGIEEVLDWARTGEAALAGTAAVLAPVGAFVHGGRRHPVGDGSMGPNTARLREALLAIQRGEAADPHDWTQPV